MISDGFEGDAEEVAAGESVAILRISLIGSKPSIIGAL
jgi:hypothetical protein